MQTDLGDLVNPENKTGETYIEVLDSVSEYRRPHEFVGEAYGFYSENYESNNSVNGKVFEWLICEVLVRERVTPFYFQARFERVPNVDFDIVLYHRKSPVVFSCKTSLRERYKQADLEGMALRQVYRNAESYLITLDHKLVLPTMEKIEEGDIAGINECVYSNGAEFTNLVGRVAKRTFSEADAVVPISKGQLVS